MDLIETADEYRIEMDIPGIELERIEVTAGPVRGTVRVVATATEQRETAGGQMLLGERRARAAGVQGYTRTIPIGWDADVGSAKKTLKNGVLRVFIPRLPQTPKVEPMTNK